MEPIVSYKKYKTLRICLETKGRGTTLISPKARLRDNNGSDRVGFPRAPGWVQLPGMRIFQPAIPLSSICRPAYCFLSTLVHV